MSAVVNEIIENFRKHGHQHYGESVTQQQHMLQCATFAEQDGAKASLIVAAVLHDYGHLIHGLDEDIADEGVDGQHEEVGAEWLEQHFPPEVTEPIRLHVAAKRYLCAVDANYLAQLSPASKKSLQLQGGPFNADEIKAFEANPHFEDAVQLRHYDDRGKILDMPTPDLEHFRPLIEAALKPQS